MSVTAQPSPVATSSFVPPAAEQVMGEYTIQIWNDTSGFPQHLTRYGYYGTAVIGHPQKEPLLIEGGHAFYPLPAADLTGEGEPDVMIRTRSGGSHCCHGVILVNLGSEPEIVLKLSGGSGSIGGNWLDLEEPFVDLDQDGVYEIIGRESVFLNCTVPTARVVLQWQNGRYQHIGAQYPHLYQEEIAAHHTRLQSWLAEGKEVSGCLIAELLLAHYYAGQPEQAGEALDRYYLAPDKADFLEEIEAALGDPQLFYSQR